MRRAVIFRRACVMSVPSAESHWLTLDPGPFTFILYTVSAASPLQLIRLPHRMSAAHDLRRRVHHRVNLLAVSTHSASVNQGGDYLLLFVDFLKLFVFFEIYLDQLWIICRKMFRFFVKII